MTAPYPGSSLMSGEQSGGGFTPGPWCLTIDASGSGDEIYGYDVAASNGLSIAYWDASDNDNGWTEANARLIAAAPALYEALEYLVSLGGGDCLDPARAALAQARGDA